MTETVKQKKGQMDLTQGNVTKGFLVFMIPIILGNIFTQLYNMVDSIIVGQFVGGDALAAVGASFSLTMMINSFLISILWCKKSRQRQQNRQHGYDCCAYCIYCHYDYWTCDCQSRNEAD